LQFFAYGVGETSQSLGSSQEELLDALRGLGFEINALSKLRLTSEDLLNYYNQINKLRFDLPYEIDGLVYKVNVLKLQDKLAHSAKAPRWALAHKFPTQKVQTQLLSIEISIGRTGILTPFAVLEPAMVGGACISKASLHNEDEIRRQDFRPKDWVWIERAGDVIPKVISVILEKRPVDSVPFVMSHALTPQGFSSPVCPSCNQPVARDAQDYAWRCNFSILCPAQKLERLVHFTSRDALDIEGLGEKTLKELIDYGYVAQWSDIFTLKKRGIDQQLMQHKGFGELSVAKLLNAIDMKRKILLHRLLYGLGIREIGQVTAQKLAEHFVTLEAIKRAATTYPEQLLALDSIGQVAVDQLHQFFIEPKMCEAMMYLEEEIEILPFRRSSAAENTKFSSKTYVITGKLLGWSRQSLKNRLQALGAKVASSVSSGVDYVIIGQDPGKNAQKAYTLNCHIIREEDLDAWLT
jgi:DNA ligase (NAD+)